MSSPHVRDRVTTSSIMLKVIIALVPALAASIIIFGVRALILAAVCIVSSVLFEYLYRKLLKLPNTIADYSAAVTGLILAMNLPVTIPLWMAVIGCFVAIVVVKQLFGGIGCNFANPALVGRIVLFISFATQMSNFVIPQITNGKIELVSGATPLALMASGETEKLPSLLHMFLGVRGGSMGEVCALALIIGGIFLIVTKVITATTPLIYIGTVALFAWIFGADPLYHVLSGGLLLCAFFMATDYTTSPMTEKGKAIFAFGCGFITIAIRVFGSYPEGASFALLIMNILTPHINSLTRSKPFGGAKE